MRRELEEAAKVLGERIRTNDASPEVQIFNLLLEKASGKLISCTCLLFIRVLPNEDAQYCGHAVAEALFHCIIASRTSVSLKALVLVSCTSPVALHHAYNKQYAQQSHVLGTNSCGTVCHAKAPAAHSLLIL